MMSSVDLLLQAAGCSGGVSSHSVGGLSSRGIRRPDSADHKRALFANFAEAQSLHSQTSYSNFKASSLPPEKDSADHKRALFANFAEAQSLHSRTSYSSVKASSLPPKKRMRIDLDVDACSASSLTSGTSRFSGCTDSPTLSSEGSEVTAAEMKRRGELLGQLQVCDTVIVPAKRSNRKYRHHTYPSVNSDIKFKKAVKDVDGNDLCMGYFSMSSQESPTPESVLPSVKFEAVKEEKQNKPTIPPYAGTKPAVVNADRSKNKHDASITAKSLLYQAYLQALNEQTTQ